VSPQLLEELSGSSAADAIVVSVEGRMTYECDMHTFYKGAPDWWCCRARTEQVQAIVQACRRAKVPIVPRGSGTGLIGGAMAPQGGVMVGMNRMASILEIDYATAPRPCSRASSTCG
jgi:glycolate oxidase